MSGGQNGSFNSLNFLKKIILKVTMKEYMKCRCDFLSVIAESLQVF